jgi:hypothetical protein
MTVIGAKSRCLGRNMLVFHSLNTLMKCFDSQLHHRTMLPLLRRKQLDLNEIELIYCLRFFVVKNVRSLTLEKI